MVNAKVEQYVICDTCKVIATVSRILNGPVKKVKITFDSQGLEPLSERETVFRRVGYFEQCYWDADEYVVFSKARKDNFQKVLTIV